jgi:hypothetical protein
MTLLAIFAVGQAGSNIISIQLMNEYLSRASLQRYSESVCRIVCEELEQSGLFEWEDVAEKIAARLATCTTELQNDVPPKVKK